MAFLKKELSTSQKQPVIKLIKKSTAKKGLSRIVDLYVYSMSMLNWSQGIIKPNQKLLPNLISSNQNAHVTNRFISEGAE